MPDLPATRAVGAAFPVWQFWISPERKGALEAVLMHEHDAVSWNWVPGTNQVEVVNEALPSNGAVRLTRWQSKRLERWFRIRIKDRSVDASASSFAFYAGAGLVRLLGNIPPRGMAHRRLVRRGITPRISS